MRALLVVVIQAVCLAQAALPAVEIVVAAQVVVPPTGDHLQLVDDVGAGVAVLGLAGDRIQDLDRRQDQGLSGGDPVGGAAHLQVIGDLVDGTLQVDGERGERRQVGVGVVGNSTSQGEVLTERRLRRHRTRAGFRIGDAKHLDLFRYLAWIADRHHEPVTATDAAGMHIAHKERERARAALASESGRDIGDLPPVADTTRKAAAERSFQAFCDVYFPQVFHLPWSDDHLKVIAKIEQAVLHGGLFAMAMPRGSGKTTIAECACLWAVLYGHRDFVCLIGSDEGHAADMLESLKTELESNELLEADFPEAVYPIAKLVMVTFQQWLREFGKGLGLRLHPHLLRHSIAVHLLRGGADIRHVQEFLGHACLETTKIYLRLVPGHLREDYDQAMPEIAVQAAQG